jgi:hypothetical protein
MWRALPPPLDVLVRLRAASNTTENDLKSSRLAREWSLNDQPWLSPDGHIAKKPAQYFSLLRPI